MNMKTFLDLSGTPTPKSYGMNFKQKKHMLLTQAYPQSIFQFKVYRIKHQKSPGTASQHPGLTKINHSDIARPRHSKY